MKKKVFVRYGRDPFENTVSLLEHMDPASKISADSLIGIKPNLEFSKPSNTGATTDPGVVDGIIHYLKSKGLSNIIILEGSSYTDTTNKAYKVCGYNEIAEKHGIKLVDLQKDTSIPLRCSDNTLFICSEALSVDYLINVPVLKGDSRIKISASLKNMIGCVPNSEKRRMYSRGLNMTIPCLNSMLQSDLIIVDSIVGDLDFEMGGTPVNLNRVIGGYDPVLTDSYCSSLMGFSHKDIDYITESEKRGVGCCFLKPENIIEINKHMDSCEGSSDIKKLNFSKIVTEKDACAGCHAGLIHALSRMRENNELFAIDSKIYIGKYFRKKRVKNNGIGIGNCCRHFDRYVKGCPPSAADIIDYLKAGAALKK